MRKHLFSSSRLASWLLGLGLSALAWLFVCTYLGGALEQIQERSGDWVWKVSSLGAAQSSERRVILVDIDEKSLQELGPWPWSRTQLARLMEKTGSAGAQLQLYDIVFPESRQGDDVLAKAIATYHPVFSQILALQTPIERSQGQLRSPLNWTTCPTLFDSASGYLANQGSWNVNVGHITPRLSEDGILRHQPAIICYENQAYPSLALAGVMQLSGDQQLSLQPGKWNESAWQLSGKNLVPQSIALNAHGDVRFPWRLPASSFVSVSAADVVADRMPKDLFKNAVVLVGSTAFGLNDAIATPLNPIAAGMQAHAELLVGMLDNDLPFTPRFAPAYQVGIVVLGLAVLALLVYWRCESYWLPVVGLGFACLYWLIFVLALWRYSWWLGWTQPALFVLMVALFWSALEHARSRWDRDLLYEHLSSYLPAPVAQSLALQSPSNAIRAAAQMAVVMVADIRNFSAYCEARPSEEAAAVLHAFFTQATQIVGHHGGELEAFQGDAIIAIWRLGLTPAADENRIAALAIGAAKDLLSASLSFLPDPAPAGLAPLALGIGMDCGTNLVGSFGLAKRRTHLVLGPTVSVANALVAMSAELSHPILIGESLAAHLSKTDLQSLGEFLPEGLKQSLQVYAIPLS